MFRLSIVALIAALGNAATPDNVSSRLMIHVSALGSEKLPSPWLSVGAAFSSVHFLRTFLLFPPFAFALRRPPSL